MLVGCGTAHVAKIVLAPAARRDVCRGRSQTPPRSSPGKFSASESLALSDCVLEEHQDSRQVLRIMQEKARACWIDGKAIAQASVIASRKKALSFLLPHFLKLNLRDEWSIAAIFLLDRVASKRTSSDSISSCTSMSKESLHAEWLAATLIVLKQSQAAAELGTRSIKDLLCKFANVGEHEWDLTFSPATQQAELRILQLLEYRVFIPTPLDFASHIASDLCRKMRTAPAAAAWLGLDVGTLRAPGTALAMPTPLFSLLVAFLTELALAHVPADVYSTSVQPAALALVAVRLSLHAFGAPPDICIEQLQVLQCDLITPEDAELVLPPLAKVVHSLWAKPPADSLVAKKWRAREARSTHRVVLPSAPANLPACLRYELCTPQTPKQKRSLVRHESSCKRKQSSVQAGVVSSSVLSVVVPRGKQAKRPRIFENIKSAPQTPQAQQASPPAWSGHSTLIGCDLSVPVEELSSMCLEFQFGNNCQSDGSIVSALGGKGFFGIEVMTMADSLVIDMIKPDGLFAIWNLTQTTAFSVATGDAIIEVNGESGVHVGGHELRRKLQASGEFEIKIRRTVEGDNPLISRPAAFSMAVNSVSTQL